MKHNKMKTIVVASLMTITGAASSAFAAETLHVSVPFAFMVGGAKMDAGNYSVSQLDNGVVTVSGDKTSAMVLTVPSDYSKKNATGLSFTSTESNPVLTGIQLSGAITREIPLHSSAEHKVSLVSAR